MTGRSPVPAPASARTRRRLTRGLRHAPIGGILLIAACGGGSGGGGSDAPLTKAEHMALYCQTTRCLCIEDTLIPFGGAEKREPDWRLSGEPHCPAGFHLEAVDD